MRNQKNQNFKDEIIPMEKLEHGEKYAFTITIEKQCRESLPQKRIMVVTRRTKDLLQRYNYIKFEIYPEISTYNCNIHFHGYIIIKDFFLFYMEFIPFMVHNASMTIKPINDEDKWREYVFKNKRYMERLYNHMDIHYKITHRTNNSLDGEQSIDDSNILEFFLG